MTRFAAPALLSRAALTRSAPTRSGLVALLGAGALALSACGGGSADPAPSSAAPSSSEAAASSSSSSSSDGPTVSREPLEGKGSDDSSASEESSTAPAGGEAPEAAEVWKDVRRSLDEAESVRLEARAPGEEVQRVEIAGALDGSATQGSVQGGPDGIDGAMEFIHVDGQTFVKVNEPGSDTDLGELDAALDGRWLEDTQGMVSPEDMSAQSVFEELGDAMDSATDADLETMEGEVVRVDGETMYRYSDDSDWTMTVDRDRRLRGFAEGSGGTGQTVVFEDWDAVAEPVAPTGEDVVTMEELMEEIAGDAGASSSATVNS